QQSNRIRSSQTDKGIAQPQTRANPRREGRKAGTNSPQKPGKHIQNGSGNNRRILRRENNLVNVSLYAIEAPASGLVKIGSSENPHYRFKTIQAMSPEML